MGGAGGAGGGYTVISSEGFEPMSCSPMLAGAAANLGVDSIELWEAPYLPGGTSITRFSTCPSAVTNTTSARPGPSATNSM